jgi:prepilin-type N-terminal cleavage/methylation domain-containing protein
MTAPRRGFTLLEVMAAVAVLALVYTALASAAMQGLSQEGEARRRLHASLLADQLLAGVEAQLAGGVAPAAGATEGDEGDFTWTIDVQGYDGLGSFAAGVSDAAAKERGEPARRADQQAPAPADALLIAAPGQPPPLLVIAVHVRWTEGFQELEVTRTTFASDPAAVAAALGAGSDAEGGGAAQPSGKTSGKPTARPKTPAGRQPKPGVPGRSATP